MAEPLKGIRIVGIGGIGPAPFAAMMLADHGAEVIRWHRMAGMADTSTLSSKDRKQPSPAKLPPYFSVEGK